MAHPVAEAFSRAAELIRGDDARAGNCLTFEPGMDVIYTGDIHGNRRNLAKIITYADLGFHPRRRLVLQEIIHGGPADADGGDRSFELLLRAVRLKTSYPDQVFFLMGNHDLAQFAAQEIAKNGHGMCKSFEAGLDRSFGPDAAEVRSAVYGMLESLPLAARCENGIFMTHSLPAPNRMPKIDWGILDRPYRQEDFPLGGSLYEWTWGRGHTPEQIAELADRLDAKQFLLGHQPVESGFEVPFDGLALLSSHHAHGKIIAFNSSAEVAPDDLPELVEPIVAL